MTPTEIRAARQALGLSTAGMASMVGVASGRTVRRWEAGDSAVPASVKCLVKIACASPEGLAMVRAASLDARYPCVES